MLSVQSGSSLARSATRTLTQLASVLAALIALSRIQSCVP